MGGINRFIVVVVLYPTTKGYLPPKGFDSQTAEANTPVELEKLVIEQQVFRRDESKIEDSLVLIQSDALSPSKKSKTTKLLINQAV